MAKAKTPATKSSKKTSKLNIVEIEHKPYPEAIDKRFFQVRFNMEDNKINAAFISHLPNIRYLTNFSGSLAFMIITNDAVHFFTDDRYEEQVKTELYDLHNLKVHITRDVWQYIEDIGILNPIKALGVEAEYISHIEAVSIRQRVHPRNIKFKAITELIEPYTEPKSSEEIESIQKSCNIAEQVFDHILSFIKPGITELQIAIELEHKARLLGSEGVAFDTIVTSGARGALVHGQPSNKKIKRGDIVLMDFGCKVNGFCSDITRTVCVGRATAEQKQMYKLVYEAMSAAIEEVRPGMKGNYLDDVARKIIKKAGYGDYFKHSLGHGLGLVCHEKPTITFRLTNQIIPEDVVLAIEPGIYIPDQFGIRIEDDVIVENTKNIKLTNAPEKLIVI